MKHLKLFEGHQKNIYKLEYGGELDVRYKNLTSLYELPEGIRDLYCYDNKLTTLPNLPDGMIKLYCSHNNLTFLPKLPDSLERLDCDYNKITSLPELPKGLTQLECSNNKIITLPKLPEGLEYIKCYNNPLECLIPNKFIHYQTDSWLNEYYYPYIGSYEGQRNILTRQPGMVKELIEQTTILDAIKKEFAHLFTGNDLNLL